MKLYKNIIKDEDYELVFENDDGDIFKIHYAGGDLYWTMINYHSNNKFLITKEETIYFNLQQLFKKIESFDLPYDKTFNDNCFEWLSEAYGVLENAHKLLIKKEEDYFIIKFIRNPNNFLVGKLCPICFCLSGSRNPRIAYAFSSMFLDFNNNDKIKTLIKH